jgi:hypothetical protein
MSQTGTDPTSGSGMHAWHNFTPSDVMQARFFPHSFCTPPAGYLAAEGPCLEP